VASGFDAEYYRRLMEKALDEVGFVFEWTGSHKLERTAIDSSAASHSYLENKNIGTGRRD
jgi:hypothetical protein